MSLEHTIVKYLEHMILLLETKAILNVDFIET
jgi:hypothetical protein